MTNPNKGIKLIASIFFEHDGQEDLIFNKGNGLLGASLKIIDEQKLPTDKKNIEIIIKSAIENELIFAKTGLYILINFYFFVI
jgi:hypothetical protein